MLTAGRREKKHEEEVEEEVEGRRRAEESRDRRRDMMAKGSSGNKGRSIGFGTRRVRMRERRHDNEAESGPAAHLNAEG
jgi:hypothetical protein